MTRILFAVVLFFATLSVHAQTVGDTPCGGGCTMNGQLIVNSSATATATLAALTEPLLNAGQYGVFRIGRDAGFTTFRSGYVAYVPNATANQGFMALGIFGQVNDILQLRGDGVILVGGTVAPVAAVSCAAGTVSTATLVVTNGIVTHC